MATDNMEIGLKKRILAEPETIETECADNAEALMQLGTIVDNLPPRAQTSKT